MSERIATCLCIGLALFWCGASVFVRGDGVPDWWLPAALAAGLAAAARLPAPHAAPAPRWLSAGAWLTIGCAAAAVAYGAVATPSRHWDGAASFDAKVSWLARTPTLQQPFFAAEGVFHHSPDYPLLQSLLVAAAERLLPGWGRLILPLLYLLLACVVHAALQRRRVRARLRVAVVLAVALTPALLAPGGGAVDSGYHELLLLLATTTMAAGFLTDQARFVALGALLAIVGKPEGLPYALLALAVAFARGEPRLWWPTFAAIAVALVTWEPVRQLLLHRTAAGGGAPALWSLRIVPVAAVTLFAIDRLLCGLRLSHRGRWLVVLAAPLTLLLALPWLAPLFAGDQGALSLYLRHGDRVYAGFANLPAYAAALLDYGVLRLRIGAALVLPCACVAVALRQGVALAARDLRAFVLLGLATSALPFVLSPESDLQHHLRSSLPRLLLHWVGPAWLLTAAWLDALLEAPVDCEPAAAAPS